MSELSYLVYSTDANECSNPFPPDDIDEEDEEDILLVDGDDEEELNANEKILTSIYLQSNRNKFHHQHQPISSNTTTSSGETDNDSEKDANNALASIHISEPVAKLKHTSQSPSPLTDDAGGSLDSPVSSRLPNDSFPYISSLPKQTLDHQDVPNSLPNVASSTTQNSFSKQGVTKTSSTQSGSSYTSNQIYNRPPSTIGFLPSANSVSSTTPSFLNDDFLLLTPSQQSQSSTSVSANASTGSYLLTPLLSNSSTNSVDSLHNQQLDNASNQKYSAFPTATPHSVSELYYPLRDIANLTPNMTSIPSTVSGQQVNSRSSPLQVNQPSRKQSVANSSRAGRGKSQATHGHVKNSSATSTASSSMTFKASTNAQVPPGLSNTKPLPEKKPANTISAPLSNNSSSTAENLSSDSFPSTSNSLQPTSAPQFTAPQHSTSASPNGAVFSSNMATIQQVKKKFSSVVKSSTGTDSSTPSSDILMSSINGSGNINGNSLYSQHALKSKPIKSAPRKSRKGLHSHTPGTRLERSVSDLGTTDHLYGDSLANFDTDNFHFAAFLDSHMQNGFKPEVKNRSLSWQHSGSSNKQTIKPKNTERKTIKSIKTEGGTHSNLSSPGLLISNSNSQFGDPPIGNGLENLFNQPIKKKRTSKGAKFRMFTRVWVPAFNIAGTITQEKNGGWKYVQFDNGLPLPLPSPLNSSGAAAPQSPRMLSKGLMDGKWCRACDMEEIQDGVVPNISANKDASFPQNHARHDGSCDNDSDAEFDGNLLGIADSFGLISGNPLQYFSQNSNHTDLGSDDEFGTIPMNNSSTSRDVRGSGQQSQDNSLNYDLDQLDTFLMKRRRDRADSLDLLNTTLSLSEKDDFLTLGMNTKLEDSMKLGSSALGGGVLDDVAWHNIECGISLDDCDWNL